MGLKEEDGRQKAPKIIIRRRRVGVGEENGYTAIHIGIYTKEPNRAARIKIEIYMCECTV